MAHVFVYGTLMRGGANHAVLARLRARYVAAGRTEDGRTLIDLGPYPALLPRAPARDDVAPRVHGEIYAVDDDALTALDAFEGCPELYVRERIAVRTDDGVTEAFTYVLSRRPPKSARTVPGGRYAPEPPEPEAAGDDE